MPAMLITQRAIFTYHPEIGNATVPCTVGGDPLQVTVQFLDGGKPYNPLLNEDPNVTLTAEERSIGGLGIYMVKKSMDEIEYQYLEEKNVLTIRKKILN